MNAEQQLPQITPHLVGEMDVEVETPKELASRYTFLSKLGGGTQGSVYKAVRRSDGKVLAIKRLRIDSVNTWKEYDLFHREADVLASINEHGVAEFYEAVECLKADPPAAYIVQELIEGRSLQVMLKTGFRFTVSRIFQMALDILNLLEKLHKHDPPIIHRDIKPNNIIMKPLSDVGDFAPYLIDFGAVANPTVQKGGSTVAGTYGYMPPEQLIGRPCPASDIYALGATIVYMLCGVEPAEMRVADFRLVIDPYLENVPRPIVTVLHQMLDPKPETRLCDYDRLRDILEHFANDNYSIDQEQNKLDEQIISERLVKVNAFNQAGNLDLWMQLNEKVPRNVPRSVAATILTSDSDTKKEGVVLKTDSQQYGIFILIAIGIGVGSVLVMLIQALWSTQGALAVLGVLVAILIAFIVSNKKLRDKKRNSALDDKLKALEMINTESGIRGLCGWDDIDNAPILTLLKLGRKAIATIVDFEDFPVPAKQRTFDARSRSLTSIYRVPFRLRYRFNPPDDASADDLVHEIIIYNHQTEGLEPGTPIPILYYINPKDNSDVISMPYPFPFKEIADSQVMFMVKDNLYGHTNGVY